jgi:hypothetical protein
MYLFFYVIFFLLFASVILVYCLYGFNGFSSFNGFSGFNGFSMYIMTWYRYQHPKTECYKRSEKLIQLVSTTLWRYFVHISNHLDKIWKTKGVSFNEGCMDQSLFTGISITHDYYCNIHNDSNDFSYSFFVWCERLKLTLGLTCD